MSLNKKHFDIVTYLIHSAKTINELACIFNMSSRNIRYTIENINFYLNRLSLPLIALDHGALQYSHDATLFFGHHNANNFIFSKEERDEYLAIMVLFQPSPRLSHIRDYLKISNTTLNKDLKRVNETFNQLAIQINTCGDIISVTGKEKQIRYLTMRYASKYFYFKSNKIHFVTKSYFYEQDIITEIQQYIQNVQPQRAINSIKIMETQYNKQLESDFKNIFTIYLIVSLNRIKQGVFITQKNNGDFLELTQLYPIICHALQWQQRPYKYEALHLTEYFLSNCNTESFFEKRFQVESFIYQMLTIIDNKLSINLVTDTCLITDIINYLTTAVYRAKNNLTLHAFDNSNASHDLFNKIKWIAAEYQHYLVEPLRDEEISYITELVNNAINRAQKTRIPLSQLLRLAQQHSHHLNCEQFIIDTLDSFNSLVFDDRDLADLMTISYTIKDILPANKTRSLTETIKWLCEQMEQKEFVTPEYTKGVLSLLYAHSHDYFVENHVLVCHGKCPSHSKKLTITTLQLTTPIIDAQKRKFEQIIMISNIDNVKHLQAIHQLHEQLNKH